MSTTVLVNLDMTNNQVLNMLLQSLPSDPSNVEAKVYYNNTAKEIRFFNGTTWVALGPAGAGGPPTGGAGGDLTGSYPNPTLALNRVKVAGDTMTGALIVSPSITANSDLYINGNTATPARILFSYGSSSDTFIYFRDDIVNTVWTVKHDRATKALRVDRYVSGTFTDSPLSISNTTGRVTLTSDPTIALEAATKQYVDGKTATGTAGGDLSGTYPNPQIATGVIVDADVAAANKDGTAVTPSLRTLGSGALQACAGNDSRLSDSRAPTGAAGGDLTGSTYPNPVVANLAITDAKVAAANKDGVAGTASMRTLGSGAQQACAGNDARLSDARTPLSSASATGDLAGSTFANLQIAAGAIVDADVASANKDGAVGTYSLRTLGSGAQQAMPGNRTLDAITAPAADLSLNSKKITNLADPAAATDAATKNYVDNISTGLDAKASVKAATTANIVTLAGGAPNTLDGVTLANNDRVLVKDQTTQSANGIYTVTTVGTGSNGTWTRATDMDNWLEVPSAYTWVEQGTLNADTGWNCTADQGGTLGTTNITWVLFSSAGATIAGAGLTKTGNTIDLVSATADATVAADSFTIVSAPKWTTGRTISLTGDVTGTSVAFDGTANLSFATTLASSVPNKFFAVNVGDGANGGTGANVAPVITHSLNTKDVTVEVYRNSTPWDTVMCDVERTTVNTITLRFSVAPAANTYRVVVQGR